MSDDNRLENIPPLGRPAEDVEAEDANRTNPSTPREILERGGLPPIPFTGGTEGTPMAPLGEDPLLGSERGADTTHRDNSDDTE